jgi:hypothetical protein
VSGRFDGWPRLSARREPPDGDLLNALIAELNRLAMCGLERAPRDLDV